MKTPNKINRNIKFLGVFAAVLFAGITPLVIARTPAAPMFVDNASVEFTPKIYDGSCGFIIAQDILLIRGYSIYQNFQIDKFLKRYVLAGKELKNLTSVSRNKLTVSEKKTASENLLLPKEILHPEVLFFPEARMLNPQPISLRMMIFNF